MIDCVANEAVAARLASHPGSDLGAQAKQCPLGWRFDILAVADWLAEATLPVLPADLLIISTSSPAGLPVAIQDWVRSCLSRQPGHAAVVVALLGPADDPDTPDSPRIQFLMAAAAAAGLGFFAPTPHATSSPLTEALGLAPSRPAHQILLVEDDRAIRQLSTSILVRAGYQVNTVGGSQVAWEALQAHRYDLLITDNRMPGMSGLELVRKLRTAQSALPVIIASGGFAESDLTHNQWLQPATVLPKPFTVAALLHRVAEVLPLAAPGPPSRGPALPPNHWNQWGINE
jgi:CheY-like chemotaxis protein